MALQTVSTMNAGWKPRGLKTARRRGPGSKCLGKRDGEEAQQDGSGAAVEELEGLGMSDCESNTPLTNEGLCFPKHY